MDTHSAMLDHLGQDAGSREKQVQEVGPEKSMRHATQRDSNFGLVWRRVTMGPSPPLLTSPKRVDEINHQSRMVNQALTLCKKASVL